MKSFILFLYFVLLTLAQPKSEAVNHLPGYSGLLPTTWYSGLLPCGKAPGIPHGDMFMHYVFVESQKDPENAPIVMWMNGGPGASSMFGLFVELGPLELNINSLLTSQYNLTKLPSLIQNIFSWNSFSNLLIFDSPPPVGFSYCEPSGPKGDPTSCGPWNDTTTANANYEALKSWAKKFPNFSSEKKQRDFFITGESYAGVYVPNLAEKVLDNPIPGIHLAGFAVGDGCMGIDVVCGNGKPQGPFYFLEFMYGHGQISNKLYNEIREKCPTANLKNNSLSPECQTLTKQAHEEVGGYYGYNLYDNCGENNIFAKSALANVYPYNSEHFQPSKITGVTRMGYPCPGPAMGEWISRTDVRHDLHVDPASNFFSGDNGVGFNYSLTEKNVLPFYERVLKTTNLRVLVYNGDADPGLNSFLTQDAYSNFFELQKFDYQKWRPWTLDGKTFVGGYVFSYKPKEKNSWNFHYLTIRGSGHMVPEFMPRPARSFMEDFVMGREFPNYIP